jgi:hypothetical protein
VTGEEVGKVVGSTIDALKSQPMLLALVVFQVLILGAILYSSLARQKAASEQFASLVTLLDHCVKQ